MVAPIAVVGGGLALSLMASAIKGLYGMGGEINAYLDRHIVDMKGSESPLVSRSGHVLEMAKLGFGIGYITPVVIIAAGQLLMGNALTGPVAALGTLASAATLTNPIAMTCGAIGAVYFGWGALSEVERQEILDKLSKGLEIGVELIKAMVRFVVGTMKELFSSKNLEEIKKYIASTAAVFGKSLSDVTHKVADVVSEGLGAAKKIAGEAMDKTGDLVTDGYDTAKEAAQKAADGTREVIKKMKRGAISTNDPQAGKGEG